MQITIGVIISALAFLMLWSQIEEYLYGLVDKRINEPEYIQRISEQIRPFVILNWDGVVLADGGALKYIDSLSILDKSPWGNCFLPRKILIKPKEFMQNEPIVQCLSPEALSIRIKRIPTISWLVIIDEPIVGPMVDSCDMRFRIELIR